MTPRQPYGDRDYLNLRFGTLEEKIDAIPALVAAMEKRLLTLEDEQKRQKTIWGFVVWLLAGAWGLLVAGGGLAVQVWASMR